MGRSLFKQVYHRSPSKYSIFCLPSQSRRYAWVGAGLARPASPLASPQEIREGQAPPLPRPPAMRGQAPAFPAPPAPWHFPKKFGSGKLLPFAAPQEMHNVQGLHYSLFIHHYSLFCPCHRQPDDLLRPGDTQAGGALGHGGPAGDHVVHQDHLFPREVDPLPRRVSSRHVGLSGG